MYAQFGQERAQRQNEQKLRKSLPSQPRGRPAASSLSRKRSATEADIEGDNLGRGSIRGKYSTRINYENLYGPLWSSVDHEGGTGYCANRVPFSDQGR